MRYTVPAALIMVYLIWLALGLYGLLQRPDGWFDLGPVPLPWTVSMQWHIAAIAAVFVLALLVLKIDPEPPS